MVIHSNNRKEILINTKKDFIMINAQYDLASEETLELALETVEATDDNAVMFSYHVCSTNHYGCW